MLTRTRRDVRGAHERRLDAAALGQIRLVVRTAGITRAVAGPRAIIPLDALAAEQREAVRLDGVDVVALAISLWAPAARALIAAATEPMAPALRHVETPG